MNRFRIIIAVICFICFANSVNAQVGYGYKAVGLRLGGGINDRLIEISFQLEYDFMRHIEADMFAMFQKPWFGYGLAALHQWRFPIKDKWSWYVGVGGALGSWRNSVGGHEIEWQKKGAFFAIPLDGGIEYDMMHFPWRFGLDLRYNIPLINQPGEDVLPMLTLSVRYLF